MTQENEEKDDLVMVGDGIEEGDQPDIEKKTVAKSDKDEDDEDEDDVAEKGEKEDKRLAHAEDEEEGEDADQTTRRQERQKRKQRQREARERNERELRFYRTRTEQLERQFAHLEKRTRGTEAATIEARMSQLRNQIETAKEVEARAIEANSGSDAIEAREIREELEEGLERLEMARERLAKEPTHESREPPPEARQALAWIDRHKSWYDPTGKDEDSAIAQAIENSLLKSREFDPRTPEYWEELDKRLAKRLPHRFKKKGAKVDDDDQDDDLDDEEEDLEDARPRKGPKPSPARKAGGPRISVGGRERPLKPNEVYISPARKAAMIEAGVWDDPKLRSRMLKQYRQWDQENSN